MRAGRHEKDMADMWTIQGGSARLDGIRTFPFPVELSVGGVGMQVGPMGDRPHLARRRRRWSACTASTSMS